MEPPTIEAVLRELNRERSQRELLTLTLPRFKAGALDFMRASTEISGAGSWQHPDSVSNDIRADNVILEVNEQVLYARMINVEESTLIE